MIETERLILRPWRDADAPALYKYASDPAIGPIGGWYVHTSVENSMEIIRTVFAAPEVYTVVLKDKDEPVGCFGIMFPDDTHTADMKSREAEIGYRIGKPFWGQGLIPEAVGALLSRYSTIWSSMPSGAHTMTETQNRNGSARKPASSIITRTRTSHPLSATPAPSISI